VADTEESEAVREHQEWAIRIHCPIGGVPGPHLLLSYRDENVTRMRYAWWCEHRPDAQPELLTRIVLEFRERWRPTS
jgi:hypothetical protein